MRVAISLRLNNEPRESQSHPSYSNHNQINDLSLQSVVPYKSNLKLAAVHFCQYLTRAFVKPTPLSCTRGIYRYTSLLRDRCCPLSAASIISAPLQGTIRGALQRVRRTGALSIAGLKEPGYRKAAHFKCGDVGPPGSSDKIPSISHLTVRFCTRSCINGLTLPRYVSEVRYSLFFRLVPSLIPDNSNAGGHLPRHRKKT